MLLYSPIYLFLVPGAILLWLGISSFIWLYLGNATVAGIPLFFHPLFVSSLLIMTGYQLIIFAIFAKTYAITHLDEDGGVFNSLYKIITLERGALIGLGIIILGALIFLGILYGWVESGFGALREEGNSILALTLIVFGMQTISSSFMFSILGIEEK
jgi:hypothetical protein